MEDKYIKYKTKYLKLKNNNIGGDNKLIKAIAFFNSSNIIGSVQFEELDDFSVKVTINLKGFEPNSDHGFHVHESGDLSSGCESLCAHFNPSNCSHGGRKDSIRHVGDLGNIIADLEGKVSMEFIDHIISLRGDTTNIIGRGLIIHADPDDCGKGGNDSSKKTGNSGKRIACAIIGYASAN